MSTPVIERLAGEVAARFPSVKIAGTGVVCRKIANSNSWSQHAWGNATDLYPTDSRQGDQLYAWLVANKTRLSLATICWKNHGGCNAADHQTHIHVSGAPKKRGTPPCAGGSGSGSVVGDTARKLVETLPGIGLGVQVGEMVGGVGTSAGTTITDVTSFVAALGEPATWLRVLWFVGGAIAIVGGVVIFVKETTGVEIPAGKLAGTAIKAVTA